METTPTWFLPLNFKTRNPIFNTCLDYPVRTENIINDYVSTGNVKFKLF